MSRSRVELELLHGLAELVDRRRCCLLQEGFNARYSEERSEHGDEFGRDIPFRQCFTGGRKRFHGLGGLGVAAGLAV